MTAALHVTTQMGRTYASVTVAILGTDEPVEVRCLLICPDLKHALQNLLYYRTELLGPCVPTLEVKEVFITTSV